MRGGRRSLRWVSSGVGSLAAGRPIRRMKLARLAAVRLGYLQRVLGQDTATHLDPTRVRLGVGRPCPAVWTSPPRSPKRRDTSTCGEAGSGIGSTRHERWGGINRPVLDLGALPGVSGC